jgi:hypothetical protein
MDDVQVDLADVRGRRSRRDLAIQRVAGFEHYPIALVDPQNRRNVRVPPVVAGVRFGLKGLGCIDTYLVQPYGGQRAAGS